ncbi:hypothetical protein [Paraburkholderia sp. C35]|uniref:hypothetical protein n=1 Tax=Paraburkholderia sp. C35 TaxID=2126993 RepID=UPI000D6962B9|nr:hypothetical protein [Paraburkholderia sp. C35]
MTKAMPRPRYDAKQARTAIQSGGIATAVIRAEEALWFVEFVTREADVVDLVTARNERRSFRNAHLALKVLRELGITLAQVQMENWNQDAEPEKLWSRPDMVRVLKAGSEVESRGKVETAPDKPSRSGKK